MDFPIAKCGCNCSTCPTYKDNIRTIEERQKCSKGWSKYLGIKLNAEKLRPCDGCSLQDSERKTYYLNCKVRKCCNENEFDNCAYCSIFPCDELKTVHSLQNIESREDFITKAGKEISDHDYLKFIEPYCGIIHLEKINKELKDSDIRDYKKFSTKIKFSEFTVHENSKGINPVALNKIYSFLTSLDIQSGISYARYITLKERRKKLLLLILAISIYGALNKEEAYLELDGKILISQKISGIYYYDKLMEYFEVLRKYDIYCRLVPEDIKKYMTPTGYLKSGGWSVRMSFEHGNIDILKALKDYTSRLNKTYSKNWFKHFNSASFNVY